MLEFDIGKVKGQFDLTGNVALVTGASSGLGRAIAYGMASYGADLILSDIDEEGMAEVAESIEHKLGRQVLCIRTDITQEDQVRNMVKAATDRFSTIDIAVNNPGINCRKPVLELSLEEYERVLDVNQKGVFLCAREVGKVMVERRKGKMINMSSILGLVAMPNQAAYASSKGAVIQLTKVLALEWAPFNVQVNAIAPAHFDTPLTRQLKPELRQEILEKNPQHRFAGVDEIIGSAVFLASRASGFITGTALVLDGGWTAQ